MPGEQKPGWFWHLDFWNLGIAGALLVAVVAAGVITLANNRSQARPRPAAPIAAAQTSGSNGAARGSQAAANGNMAGDATTLPPAQAAVIAAAGTAALLPGVVTPAPAAGQDAPASPAAGRADAGTQPSTATQAATAQPSTATQTATTQPAAVAQTATAPPAVGTQSGLSVATGTPGAGETAHLVGTRIAAVIAVLAGTSLAPTAPAAPTAAAVAAAVAAATLSDPATGAPVAAGPAIPLSAQPGATETGIISTPDPTPASPISVTPVAPSPVSVSPVPVFPVPARAPVRLGSLSVLPPAFVPEVDRPVSVPGAPALGSLVGSAPPDSVITVFDGNTLLGQARAGADEQWHFPVPSTLKPGRHVLAVTFASTAAGPGSRPLMIVLSAPMIVSAAGEARSAEAVAPAPLLPTAGLDLAVPLAPGWDWPGPVLR
jgi:hypothetical protein